MHILKWKRVAALAITFVLVAAGCSSVRTKNEGPSFTTETVAGIAPGTSASVAAALLGEPSKKTPDGEGGGVWKWTRVKTTTSRVGILFIRLHSQESTETMNAYVHVKGGKVVRAWTD